MAIRRNSKNGKDPFTHTNLTTLCGSIDGAMAILCPLELAEKRRREGVDFVVNYPSFCRVQEDGDA